MSGVGNYRPENVFSNQKRTEISSCMYTANAWPLQRGTHWTTEENFSTSRITAPQRADATLEDNGYQETRPLREKNCKKSGGYKHVPHRDKPPQVVARRNARERRRVQAVNNAFLRLRKAVPIENSRGKRISKVKTLQNAIEYIQRLQELLHQGRCYEPFDDVSLYAYASSTEDFFDSMEFSD